MGNAKDQIQNHTHPVHTAKELSTLHTRAIIGSNAAERPKKYKTENHNDLTDENHKPGT